MSAQAGWYPDPGGGQGLYRYWDGRVWSAATSPNPAAPPPVPSLGAPPPPSSSGVQPYGGQGGLPAGYGTGAGSPTGPVSGSASGGAGPTAGPTSGSPTAAGTGPAAGAGPGEAYAGYQDTQRQKTPVGWWLGAAALLLVIVMVAAFVIRGLSGGGLSGNPTVQGSENACPAQATEAETPLPAPSDGRVHGGPVSYPQLGSPWGPPQGETRVPFGSDVASQLVPVEPDYDGSADWVASVLVGELQAGDGFFTPEQGAQVVVKCIIGAFYGNNEVRSDVQVNKDTKIDGHDAWVVESQLSFDVPGLRTKGELLIVAIVATGSTAGLYYASIPDTTPQLVQPARDALANLRVDS